MNERQEPSSSFHTLCLERAGVRYCAMIQHEMPENVYRFVALGDAAHQQYLPIHEIESEFVRRAGSLRQFTLHSKWAARRRLRRYVTLWEEMRANRTG